MTKFKSINSVDKLYDRLTQKTAILPLVVFRVVFGLLLCFSQLRFIFNGWVADCYTTPKFHFTYHFFSWIRPFDSATMYAIVGATAMLALCIALGLFYRIATILFFIGFTYLELIEKSWYLNHYYFVSLVAFLLIWLPAHRNYSIDAFIFKKIRLNEIPEWIVLVLKIQIAVVYFFGGIAKLKSDWLFEAQPLKIWLQARTDIPLLGRFFAHEYSAYLFSWSGMIYDLAIPFLLFNKRSRPWAYVLVVVFHVLTYVLFNIGMFPWMMIGASLLFISAAEWKRFFGRLGMRLKTIPAEAKAFKTHRLAIPFLVGFVGFQIIFPLRHYVLTDQVCWTENGFRFAWHVMVMEKNGFTEFTVVDNDTQKKFTVYPSQYLTVIQEKQMSFQPDMIWQFAQYLGTTFNEEGTKNLSVYVNAKVALNGRTSTVFIHPQTDLLAVKHIDDMYDFVVRLADD